MKYTVDYLSKQLEEARTIRNRHADMLAANPDDAALEIVALSMGDHVAEIERDLEDARSAEPRLAVASR